MFLKLELYIVLIIGLKMVRIRSGTPERR